MIAYFENYQEHGDFLRHLSYVKHHARRWCFHVTTKISWNLQPVYMVWPGMVHGAKLVERGVLLLSQKLFQDRWDIYVRRNRHLYNNRHPIRKLKTVNRKTTYDSFLADVGVHETIESDVLWRSLLINTSDLLGWSLSHWLRGSTASFFKFKLICSQHFDLVQYFQKFLSHTDC